VRPSPVRSAVPAGTADLTGDGRTELLLLVDDGRVVAVSIGE